MSGIGFRNDLSDFQQLARQLDSLQPGELNELLDALAAEGESQTRRRISVEKSGPDGSRWAEWSPGYAETRHGGHSLLENEGDLLDSIQSFVEGRNAGWGTNLVYGAIQHYGSDDTVQVPSHQRLISQAFGKELATPVLANVGAYSFKQNIEGRPYLGLSPANEEDLLAVANDWLNTKMQGAFK